MSDEPDWTAANQNKKEGDTTFKTCGWCAHRGTGSYRYNCMLSGRCSLKEDYSSDVKWDTPCLMEKMGRADIKDLIEHKNFEVSSAISQAKSAREEKAILKSLLLKVEPRPVQPDRRPSKHFKVGRKIRVWDDKTRCWKRATVVEGYRTYDGCVSFVSEPGSEPGGAGYAILGVILETEYQAFAEHPGWWKIWIKLACEKDYNGEKLDPADFAPPKMTFKPLEA